MTRILVIEDDPTQRLLTSSVLRSAGYEVTEGVDGTHGLELAWQSPPDLIVCDVLMPGLNGYQLVEALKREAPLASIPVIMLTAMAGRSHVRIGMTAGADDYLFKPFRAEELRRSVAALLAKRESQRKQYVLATVQKMNAVLQQQEDSLSLRYEMRLLQELNERWGEQTGARSEFRYDHATVLLVDLFGAIVKHLPSNHTLGSAIRQVYQAASDSLYLFGAQHLVQFGHELLAIFPDNRDIDDDPLKRKLLAVRSAFGLHDMVCATFKSMTSASSSAGASLPSIPIALHYGAVTLFKIRDALHEGEVLTLATGDAVNAAKALGEHALRCGWQVSCSATVIEGMSEAIKTGRTAMLARGQSHDVLDVVELLSLAHP